MTSEIEAGGRVAGGETTAGGMTGVAMMIVTEDPQTGVMMTGIGIGTVEIVGVEEVIGLIKELGDGWVPGEIKEVVEEPKKKGKKGKKGKGKVEPEDPNAGGPLAAGHSAAAATLCSPAT